MDKPAEQPLPTETVVTAIEAVRTAIHLAASLRFANTASIERGLAAAMCRAGLTAAQIKVFEDALLAFLVPGPRSDL